MIKNILFSLFCISFIYSCVYILNNTKIDSFVKITNYDSNRYKYLNSNVLYVEIKEENKEESVEEKTIDIVEKEEIIIENDNDKTSENKKESLDIIQDEVLESFTANFTSYGIDCYGCTSGYTASGYYIGDGNIYYNDEEFGNVRILAGDNSYPYGTIVRMNIDNEVILGIILDRGSNIGKDKKYAFDLLFKTNSEAIKYGSKNKINFEILRRGY